MSIHIMYNHQCSKCEAFYIPYEEGVVCPNCGVNEAEVYNIVVDILSSADYQMNKHGFYTPKVWWSGSFGDHVALLIFKALDAFYIQEEKSFKEFALEHFNNSKWGNQLYMKNHIYELSCKVFVELQIQNNV